MVAAAEAGLALLLFAGLSRAASDTAGTRAAIRLWLDPASMLIGAALGYLEPLYLLPAMAALFAASRGRGGLAGACLGAACLTKQLAVLFAPAVLAALWRAPDPRRQIARALAASAGAAVLAAGQVILNGGLLNMSWSVAAPLRDPFLTGNATNLWWLLGQPFGAPLDLLRVAGAVATLGAIGWAIARLPRSPDVALLAAAAGFSIHAYAVLAVSVHENHLYGAVPPLVAAAAVRPGFRGVLTAVSAVVFLNVGLFYGFELEPGPALTAGVTLLACGNCAALVWHARVLGRESSIAADRTEAPA
jgi:hypothetical protein